MTSVREELAFLRDMGFTHLDLEVTGLRGYEVTPPETSQPRNLETDDWTALREIALACTKCRLANTRTQVVYGVGNPHADLMFIGEAPGRDEDIKGEPFVGRAGQLLTDIIKAM